MSQPYIGEIRIFAGNFNPAGWELCHGQLVPIAENEALFTLIGTTYGGDGQETFGLPDLRGRLPLHHHGPDFQLGQAAGVEAVTLTQNQIPSHTHPLVASTAISTQSAPAGNVVAQSAAADLYIEDTPNVNLAAVAVGSRGGSQPHTNLQPFLAVNFIISMYGIFPTQT
jgi:microcystin-dependent protein